MSFLWRKKSSSATGIDSGHSALKIVSIEKNYSSLITHKILVNSGEIPLNQRKIKNLLSRDNRKQCMITALPSSKLDIQYISLPYMPENDLRKMITFEIEKKTECSINDVCFDYTHTESHKDSNSNKTNLIVFMCRRSDVTEYLDQLSDIHKPFKVVDTVSMALMNLYSFTIPDFTQKTLVGLDIGKSGANIVIAKNGLLFFTRFIPYYSNDDESNEFIHSSFLDGLSNEVLLTMQHCSIQYKFDSDQVKQVILTGGRSLSPNIVDSLASKLDISCSVLDLSSSNYPGNNGSLILGEDAPRYAVAAGLALRQINE